MISKKKQVAGVIENIRKIQQNKDTGDRGQQYRNGLHHAL